MIRVLIADDELYFRNYMLTAVDWHSLGFQVCCLAQNGEEVLFELSKNTINIVMAVKDIIDCPVIDEEGNITEQLANSYKFAYEFYMIINGSI